MSIKTDIYSKLEGMAIATVRAEAAVQQAKETKAGAYTSAVEAANLAMEASKGDRIKALALYEEQMNRLFDNIRHNNKGLAEKVSAEKRDKEGPNGELYKIPAPIQSAKTVILAAFKLGTALETEKGEPMPFATIRDENRRLREAAKAEEIAKEGGVAAKRAEVKKVCKIIADASSKMSEAACDEFLAAIATLTVPSDDSQTEDAKAGEKLAKAVETADEAKGRKAPARKPAKRATGRKRSGGETGTAAAA